MRITVNLATRPFVELRPLYARLRVWMLIFALVGLSLWLVLRHEQSKAAIATARVEMLDNNVQRLERQEQSYRALMQQPKDAAVLQQSDFLNGLFKRKAFSWTATMEDLETVLPPGVQVMSIDPIVAPNGHVTIRMRVSGARDRAIDLVRNLEKSRHFASPRLAAEALASVPGQNGGVMQPVNAAADVNFDILADYRPLPNSHNSKTSLQEPQTKLPTESPQAPQQKPPQKRRKKIEKVPFPPGMRVEGKQQ